MALAGRKKIRDVLYANMAAVVWSEDSPKVPEASCVGSETTI